MADFRLDRIKFRWKGNWVSGNTYTKDDIVYYEGKAFVCLQEHSASESFYTDFESAGAGIEQIVVTVSTDTLNAQANGKFYLDAVESPELNLVRGRTYEFVQNSSTNLSFNSNQNILLLSTQRDGELSGGPLFETGVTYRLDLSVVTREAYLAGFATASDRRIRFVVPLSGADRIYYYSSTNVNLGNVLNTKYASNWEVMQDGYSWAGDWTGDTFYSVDNIVKFKGYLYKCTADHTSGATSDGLTTNISSWSLFATGYNWLNTWTTNTNYDAGDVVRYNGNVYVCVARHTSAVTNALGLEDDGPSWIRVTRSDNWTQDWTTATRYVVNDLVKYGATVYRCIVYHTSAADTADGLELDQAKWEEVTQGIEFKGVWSSTTRYKVNDIVKESATLYRCTSGHTSSSIFNDDNTYPSGSSTKWEIYVPGLRYEELWSSTTQYSKGDVVLYGGYSYVAKEPNFNKIPSDIELGFWDLLKTGYKHRGEWNDSTNYLTGDVIRNNGYLYLAIDDSDGIYPDSDNTKWRVLVTGSFWRAEWDDNVEYFLGDIVTYKSTAYICIARHTSTASDSRPDLDLQQDDQDYWNILIKGDDSAVMANIGDIIIATDANEDSTVDKTALPIGLPGQVLKVSTQSLPSWSAFEEIPEVFYVSTSGIDSLTSGKSLAAPFRTVKYACEYVNTNRNKTLEVTAIAVAIAKLAALETFTTAPLLLALLTSTNPNTSNAYADVTGNGSVTVDDSVEFSRYINYYVRKIGGTPPTSTYISACKDLYDKIVTDFNTLKNEYFDFDSVTYNIGKFKNATIFIKTGLYEEVLPISVPAETALVGDELRSTNIQPATGYETSNMFYVRNGSGIRNMTLQGLYGELGEPNIFLTRRPTAGAFVSLDPGTGPNDKSVWITNKSPYIQNVTTFGTACIGMKIDGALHNGGNDSIVANDFTQVISDGIGYWADNVGRSELVSVFTYYCHIGYLATNGGILRATNGNNSYGTYGSVAEGFDNTETPITGTINNRNNEAQVEEIFTYGTIAQQILSLGYSHGGQGYTSASIAFNGAGFGAAGSFSEFRNSAISNIRIISPGDSSRPGGLNYTFVRNSAQSGNTAQIRLSAADIAGDLDYIGQRIVIISGLGVGQYAEITDYNSSTKIAIVSKETDGSSGWDHFQPGWPIEPTLDETTIYLIEPKVTAEEPIFNTSNITASSADSWKFITWTGDKFVALTGTDTITSASNTTGSSWSASNTLSSTHDATGIVYTGSKILVIANPDSGTSDTAWQSTNGTSWSTITLPFAADTWTSISSNNNGNVIILSGINQDVAYSSNDGDSWSSSSIGTTQNWNVAAYGNGKFIAVESGGNGDVAYSSDNGSTWTITSGALTTRTWTSGVYGNGRFVLIDNAGNTAISFDGISWYEGYANNGNQSFVSYGAGVFIATGDSNTISKSQDGVNWRTFADDSSTYATTASGTWQNSAFSGLNWVIVNNGDTAWNRLETGARAVLRAKIESSRITKIIIYDPGSLYTGTPTISIYDNQNTIEASYVVYKQNGVLSQPLMSNRGTGYTTATATITGNGFAEIYQENTTSLVISGISRLPGPGANLNITGINDVQYSISKVNSFTGTGPYNAIFTITPSIETEESPDHNTSFEIRERYSQVRLTGHDFLDIGTGNQSSTRYPDLYLEGEDALNARQPFNETVASGGGRVFYTSTDQDGNFRVGELFAVEQSTGIVTINASQFDLSGLTELALGGIQVGGSAVVIREFSKEPTFVANSNNIVPTQKAIRSYIESRISGGGSNASTNRLVAGQIDISSRQITTTSGLQINVPPKVSLRGGIDGDYLAIQYFASGGAFGVE